MRYIIKDGKVMASVEDGLNVDLEDIKSRGEFLFTQERVVPLPADFRGDKVVPHIHTDEERTIFAQLKLNQDKETLIKNKMKEIAERELKAEGRL